MVMVVIYSDNFRSLDDGQTSPKLMVIPLWLNAPEWLQLKFKT